MAKSLRTAPSREETACAQLQQDVWAAKHLAGGSGAII